MKPNSHIDFFTNFSSIPLILKIVCAASFSLGLLQLIALVFPVVSPQIQGVKLSSPFLIIITGLIHIYIGWGVYAQKFTAMLLVIISPFLQFSILYAQISLPSEEELQTNIMLSAAWAVIFTLYYFFSSARPYFRDNNIT